jgi:hypothetical protein
MHRAAGDAELTFVELETMGHEEQELVRCGAVMLGQDQLIVDLDEGAAHLVLGDAADLAHPAHHGQQQLDNRAPQLPGKKQIPAQTIPKIKGNRGCKLVSPT